MRAGPRKAGVSRVAAALVLGGACTGGGGGGVGPATTAPTVASTAPSSTAPSPTTSTSVGVAVTDPAGSVTLRVTGLTLPDIRSGGSGLRLLVRASSSRLTVRRKGGGAPVTACPVAGPTAPVSAADCVGLGPDSAVDIGAGGGVELRATGAEAVVAEVGVTYLPSARSTTVVTPARPAGACAVRPCEATFSLLPGGPGAFSLDGRATGGRPRMVLTSVRPTGQPGSNRTLATVEGGGSLSIRATVEAGSEARLLHQEQGPDAAFPVTAEILWP